MRGLSLVALSGGHSSSRCAGLSLSRPPLLRITGSRRTGSVVVAHGPSCSAACGIFPDQGSNPCPLHWQADSQPLRHQGSPGGCFLSWFWFLFACPDVSIYIIYFRGLLSLFSSWLQYLFLLSFFPYAALCFPDFIKSSSLWLGRVSTHLAHVLPSTFPVPLADISSQSQLKSPRIFPTHHSRNVMWSKKDARKLVTTTDGLYFCF